jgi:predicted phosphodiesterase
MRADVLVTHEAPSNHEFGFPVIDELAERMGVKMIVHGHHHRAYEATLPNGIAVVGVAKAGMYRMPAFENAFEP